MSRVRRFALCSAGANDLARTEAQSRERIVRARLWSLRAIRVAGLTLLVSAILAVTADRPDPPPPPLDPVSRLAVSDHPRALAATASDVWAVGSVGVLERISERRRAVVRTATLGHELSDIAIHDGTGYAASVDGTVVAFPLRDPASWHAARLAGHDDGPLRLAADRDGVWVADADGGRLTLLAHGTLEQLASHRFHGGISAITTGEHGTWIALPGPDEVAQVRPSGHDVRLAQRVRGYPEPAALVASGPRVWVASGSPPVLWALDAIRGRTIDEIYTRTASDPVAVTTGAGAVWLLAGDPPALYEYHGVSGEQIDGPLRLGSVLTDVASVGGGVWAADSGTSHVGRLSVPRRATQRVAEVQRAGPPERFGVTRGAYLLIDAVLLVLIAVLAGLLALTQLWAPPREKVPERPVTMAIDRRLALELAGPQPEESTHHATRRSRTRGGLSAGGPAALDAGREHEREHGRSDLYRGITDGTLISRILKDANDRDGLEHGYGELPTEYLGEMLHPSWAGGDDAALARAQRRRHDHLRTCLVYVRGTWTIEHLTDGDQRWTLPQLRHPRDRTDVTLPPSVQPTMPVAAEHVRDGHLLEASESSLDVLAVVQPLGSDERLELRMVAIFQAVNYRLPRLRANRWRRQRAPRRAGAGRGHR